MKYRDLREFIALLETRGELTRVTAPVDPRLEMTEICDRVLRRVCVDRVPSSIERGPPPDRH